LPNRETPRGNIAEMRGDYVHYFTLTHSLVSTMKKKFYEIDERGFCSGIY